MLAAVAGLVSAVYLLGGLAFIEHRLSELRFRLAQQDAQGDLVLVAIDPQSINGIGVWPWPRRLHAQAVDALLAAGASRVAFDVDFSSISNPLDDGAFAASLEGAAGRVILPAFQQAVRADGGMEMIVSSLPIERFAQHAQLASINIQPDSDGVVRRMPWASEWRGRVLPSLAATLAKRTQRQNGQFPIDFGIRAASIPQIPFIDVLRGYFDPASVAGRTILIGATSVELGDQLAVPIHRSLPGSLVQALAAESLIQHRDLMSVPPLAVVAIILVVALAGGSVLRRVSWRIGLVGLCVFVGVTFALSLLVHKHLGVQFEISPWIAAVMLVGLMEILGRVDQQSVRLLFQSHALSSKDAMMHGIVENSFDGIITLDENGVLESANRSACAMFGLEPNQVPGHHVKALLPALLQGVDDPVGEVLAEGLRVDREPYEAQAARIDGAVFPIEISAARVQLADRSVITMFVRNIEQRKAQEAALEHSALHDPLTDLPNRALFLDRVEQAILGAKRSNDPFVIMLLDLDRFKEINDTLGHSVGDQMLIRIAQRLREHLREADTVARLGGDEFAILLPAVGDLQAAGRYASRILKSLRQPFTLYELTLEVGGSLGIVLYPKHGQHASDLIQRADIAMYAAKRERRGFSIYSAEEDVHSIRRLTLMGELRRAIETDQLTLHFQPKLELCSDTIAGVEGLARWQHPTLGLIAPADFVPLAEQSDAIALLTRCVAGKAIAQIARWQSAGRRTGVAINLSVRNLQDLRLPDLLEDLLRRSKVAADRLTVEVTESAMMVNPERALEILNRLAEIGVTVSIDDFGTGYSSLAYLKDLPARELKIDRRFVDNIARDSGNRRICEATIDLAHNLGLRVIAEGVESLEDLELLRRIGCDSVQGFHIGEPLPPAELEAWLAECDWSLDATPLGLARSNK